MSEQQSASNVLMIRPYGFHWNPQTSDSNRFQQYLTMDASANEAARAEFESLSKALQDAGVGVYVFDARANPIAPDAVFPNNWVSFHEDGAIVLYPMLAPNRRIERREDILHSLVESNGFVSTKIFDLTGWEQSGQFLEGTGSLVLDRENRIAYASLSPRTHQRVLDEFSRQLKYRLVTFLAADRNKIPIYHTNVLMSVGAGFAVVCSEVIHPGYRSIVLTTLRETGHKIIDISSDQMENFAGNILELSTANGTKITVMSARAFESLTIEQKAELESYSGPLLTAEIPTIETLGGGSVRCMLAAIHLPRAFKS